MLISYCSQAISREVFPCIYAWKSRDSQRTKLCMLHNFCASRSVLLNGVNSNISHQIRNIKLDIAYSAPL